MSEFINVNDHAYDSAINDVHQWFDIVFENLFLR